MIDSMLNFNPKSNRELQEVVDGRMTTVTLLRERVKEDSLRSEVDLLLKEKRNGWRSELSKLMRKDEHQEAKKTENDLIILEKVWLLDEKNVEETSLLDRVLTLEEMQEVYQRTVFYLRRMELNMADEDCEVFLELMERWELSVPYILLVLSQGTIYNRANAGYRLACILVKHGYQAYAESLLAWVKEQLSVD